MLPRFGWPRFCSSQVRLTKAEPQIAASSVRSQLTTRGGNVGYDCFGDQFADVT